MRVVFALFLWCAGAAMAWADTALLIANTRYDGAQSLRHAAEIGALEAPLRAAGFDVILVEDGAVAAMRAGLAALLAAQERDRVLIAIAGHVAHSQSGTWILGTDARQPDLVMVGAQGIALPVVMELAARAPGRAMVLIGTEARRVQLGAGLTRGIGPVAAPQGVGVVSGAPDDLADFVRDALLRPGADLGAALGQSRDLQSHGFLSAAVPFLDAVPVSGPVAGPVGPLAEEDALWQAVRELDSAGAYRAYLVQYPTGAYVAQARAGLAALDQDAPGPGPEGVSADPQDGAQAQEAALALNRGARQQIQRDLTLLEHNTRGIDGIFGPGTRGAIRLWQEAAGFDVTGFLTAPQIALLRETAAQRAAVLEQEERRQRALTEQADRAYWQVTGQGVDEAALRAYLDRYPRGLFADVAQARLTEIETAQRAAAEAEERAAWEEVRRIDSVAAYRSYLEAYPQGAFARAAQARIAELGLGAAPGADAQAQAREAALNLPVQMRVLVEQRLTAVGLDPGPVDGNFDQQTRIALQTYQDGRGLDVTGYLDQGTVVRLLAEAIGGRIFD